MVGPQHSLYKDNMYFFSLKVATTNVCEVEEAASSDKCQFNDMSVLSQLFYYFISAPNKLLY